MSVRKILVSPEDEAQLRDKSLPVAVINKDVKKLIKDLKDTLKHDGGGAGLAAPQIGVLKRVVVVRFGQEEKKMKPAMGLINPVIITHEPYIKGFDGCLSNPGVLTWDTLRPSSLVFKATGESGEEIEMQVSGIDARLVHHEIDHLDGILFTDRLRPGGKLYVSEENEDGEEELVRIRVPDDAGKLALK